LNILYLCDEYPPCHHGGIGTVTQTLAREFVRRGHCTIVAGFYPHSRKAKSFEDDCGVLVHRFFYGSKLKLLLSKNQIIGRFINIEKEFNTYLKQVNELIEKYQIDLVELPDFSEAMYFGQFSSINYSKIKKPVIVKLHGTRSNISYTTTGQIRNKRIFDLEESLFKTASGVIAISNSIKTVSNKLYHIQIPLVTIPNGIALPEDIEYSEIDSETVIFAGTLDHNKGIFSLVKAWEIVRSKFPSLQLHLYGKGKDKFIKELGFNLPESIKVKGFVTHQTLLRIYAQSALAVFPSYSESQGMAPIEAMSVGCPTIFTKRSTGPELIEDWKDGRLIDPDNIKEIADAICYFVQNRKAAKIIGNEGRKKIRNTYAIQEVMTRHLEFYQGILKKEK
jgi:glycosyltransferase involved in cell wall biosynthesis